MIPAYIVDPSTGKALKVNGERELSVTLHRHPPKEEEHEMQPLSRWLVNSAGSKDMRVDGSVAPVFFGIESDPVYDLFIRKLNIQISDAGAKLNQFGALAELTNGLSFIYSTVEKGEEPIEEEIKTNLDLIRLGNQTAPIGAGSDAFLIDISGGGADTYLPVIDVSLLFGYDHYGLRIKKGTKSKLGFYVKDNIAGLDVFNIKATGTKI